MALMRKGYVRQLLAGAVAAVFFLLPSCGENGCYENRSSIPQAAFYAYNMPDRAIAIDSIEVYGVGHKTDSLLVEAASGTSSLYLPFRSDADTTRYVIHYASQALDDIANNDTLTFAYSRFPYFISGDCGVVFNYTITSFGYTRHLLDSAALVNPEVTNQEAETIQLFYYVAIEE